MSKVSSTVPFVVLIIVFFGCAAPSELRAPDFADRLAWITFSRISLSPLTIQPPPGQTPAGWRLWWTSGEVFPENPQGISRPQATDAATDYRAIHCSAESEKARFQITEHLVSNEAECEVVWLNEVSAGYIFRRRLWDRNELIKVAGTTGIRLPQTAERMSVEMKTQWRLIARSQAGRYITAMGIDRKMYGLVAFHLMTHESPTWLWATWLHEDYRDRMPAGYSFQDKFGATPQQTPSRSLFNSKETCLAAASKRRSANKT